MREVCVENIGPKQRARRVGMGVVGLVVGVAVVAALVEADAPRLVRLTSFLPFAIGMFGLIQARERT